MTTLMANMPSAAAGGKTTHRKLFEAPYAVSVIPLGNKPTGTLWHKNCEQLLF